MQKSSSTVGGGALPLEKLSTYVIKYYPREVSPMELAKALRIGNPPVIPRIYQEALYFDLRTLFEGEEEVVVEALQRALGEIN